MDSPRPERAHPWCSPPAAAKGRFRLSVPHAEHLLGLLVVALAGVQADVIAVDALGDAADVAAVGQFVQALRLPIPGGDPEADFRLKDQVRLVLEVELERLPGRLVVGPAGEHERPAALECLAVAGLAVAEVGPV